LKVATRRTFRDGFDISIFCIFSCHDIFRHIALSELVKKHFNTSISNCALLILQCVGMVMVVCLFVLGITTCHVAEGAIAAYPTLHSPSNNSTMFYGPKVTIKWKHNGYNYPTTNTKKSRMYLGTTGVYNYYGYREAGGKGTICDAVYCWGEFPGIGAYSSTIRIYDTSSDRPLQLDLIAYEYETSKWVKKNTHEYGYNTDPSKLISPAAYTMLGQKKLQSFCYDDGGSGQTVRTGLDFGTTQGSSDVGIFTYTDPTDCIEIVPPADGGNLWVRVWYAKSGQILRSKANGQYNDYHLYQFNADEAYDVRIAQVRVKKQLGMVEMPDYRVEVRQGSVVPFNVLVMFDPEIGPETNVPLGASRRFALSDLKLTVSGECDASLGGCTEGSTTFGPLELAFEGNENQHVVEVSKIDPDTAAYRYLFRSELCEDCNPLTVYHRTVRRDSFPLIDDIRGMPYTLNAIGEIYEQYNFHATPRQVFGVKYVNMTEMLLHDRDVEFLNFTVPIEFTKGMALGRWRMRFSIEDGGGMPLWEPSVQFNNVREGIAIDLADAEGQNAPSLPPPAWQANPPQCVIPDSPAGDISSIKASVDRLRYYTGSGYASHWRWKSASGVADFGNVDDGIEEDMLHVEYWGPHANLTYYRTNAYGAVLEKTLYGNDGYRRPSPSEIQYIFWTGGGNSGAGMAHWITGQTGEISREGDFNSGDDTLVYQTQSMSLLTEIMKKAEKHSPVIVTPENTLIAACYECAYEIEKPTSERKKIAQGWVNFFKRETDNFKNVSKIYLGGSSRGALQALDIARILKKMCVDNWDNPDTNNPGRRLCDDKIVVGMNDPIPDDGMGDVEAEEYLGCHDNNHCDRWFGKNYRNGVHMWKPQEVFPNNKYYCYKSNYNLCNITEYRSLFILNTPGASRSFDTMSYDCNDSDIATIDEPNFDRGFGFMQKRYDLKHSNMCCTWRNNLSAEHLNWAWKRMFGSSFTGMSVCDP
jgi:hypothetical protein